MDILKGINFKQNPDSEIYIGIHLPTFLSEVTANKKEWVNIKAIPFHKPSPKGYSHKAILNERKNNGSTLITSGDGTTLISDFTNLID